MEFGVQLRIWYLSKNSTFHRLLLSRSFSIMSFRKYLRNSASCWLITAPKLKSRFARSFIKSRKLSIFTVYKSCSQLLPLPLLITLQPAGNECPLEGPQCNEGLQFKVHRQGDTLAAILSAQLRLELSSPLTSSPSLCPTCCYTCYTWSMLCILWVLYMFTYSLMLYADCYYGSPCTRDTE